MNSSNYRIRRSTLDDIGALRTMWETLRLPVQDLEKRLTEFQVAEDAEGKVVGAIGIQNAGRYSCIHGEVFSDFAIADTVRPLFWDRIQNLAVNHGIVRIWTRESAPFWKQQGLQPVNAETLKKLPPAWNNPPSPDWLSLALKSEESVVSMEKELALFMEAEKQRTARVFQHARTLRVIVTFLAIALAMFLVGAIIYALRRNPGILERFTK